MIKKVILFFAVFFIFGLNTAFANEEYFDRCDVVYVSGKTGDNASTPNSSKTPVKDFATAYKYVKDGGIIIVTDAVKIDSEEEPLDAVKKDVIVTNVYKGVTYEGAKICVGETDTINIKDKAVLTLYGVTIEDNKVIISGDGTGYLTLNNFGHTKKEEVFKRIENLKRITMTNSVLRVGRKFTIEEDDEIDIFNVQTIMMYSSTLCAEFDIKIFYSKDEGNEIITSLAMGGEIETPHFEHPVKLSAWSVPKENARILYGKALKEEYFIFDTKGFTIKSDGKGIVLIKENETPEEDEEIVFSDVLKDDWFYDSVINVYQKGIMNGVSDKIFNPYGDMTRAMFVTVLYRMDNEPEVTSECEFLDVAEDSYYKDAVIWGKENGILNGYSDTEFMPNNHISREQMATFLYRYAKYRGAGINISGGLDFLDSSEVSYYAKDAFLWCVKNEIISGNEENMLMPSHTASRAETATVLDRFLKSKIYQNY